MSAVSSHTIDPDRCTAGQITEPTVCTWHEPHHWCEPCYGWYGVPHDFDHDKHLADDPLNSVGCACRGHSLRDYHYPEVFRQFAGYAKDHTLEVLHDDGLYRHLRFGKPGTSMGSFHLFTAPGRLWIEGDLGGGWSFTRQGDMLRFFNAGGDRVGRINPGYWQEKMPPALRNASKGFSEAKFKEYVTQRVDDAVEGMDLSPYKDDYPTAVEARAGTAEYARVHADLMARAEDELFSSTTTKEAYAALTGFTYRTGYPLSVERWLDDDPEPEGWRDFDHHFLLACHAIHYGAGRYAREVASKAPVSPA